MEKFVEKAALFIRSVCGFRIVIHKVEIVGSCACSFTCRSRMDTPFVLNLHARSLLSEREHSRVKTSQQLPAFCHRFQGTEHGKLLARVFRSSDNKAR